jgi:hypothetical protein
LFGWVLVCLAGDHLLLRDLGPYGLKFMNLCIVKSAVTVMLLRDFGPYGIFTIVCLQLYIFPSFLTGNTLVIILSKSIPISFHNILCNIISNTTAAALGDEVTDFVLITW